MVIEVLVCRADGSQSLELREVPDNWYDAPEPGIGEETEPAEH